MTGPAGDPPPEPDRAAGLARAADAAPMTVRGLVAAIGGPLGVVESVVPTLLFVVLQQVAAIRAAPEPLTREALLPVVLVPLALAVVLVLVRLARRQNPRSAVGGAAVVAVSAALTLVSGDANNNYLLGFVINGAYLAALLVSLLVRRPLIGVLLAALTTDRAWTAGTDLARTAVGLTLLWSGLFAVRLAVEVPLRVADATLALGLARIVLGLPLYALVLLVTVLAVQAASRRPGRAGGGRPGPSR